MNKEVIKKLKDLRIAYECAINYDYVPNKSESDKLIEYMIPEYLKLDKSVLESILTEYEGNSPNNITNLINSEIEKL